MGNLLGTSPPCAGTRIQRLSINESPSTSLEVHVDSFVLQHLDPENVVAFAIDQPQTGEQYCGADCEVYGWVIGRDTHS